MSNKAKQKQMECNSFILTLNRISQPYGGALCPYFLMYEYNEEFQLQYVHLNAALR